MGNEIAKRTPNTVATLMKQEGVNARIEEILGKRAPQFCSTLVSISRQPALAKCDPNSVLGAAITAATLDLPIQQNLGFAYIVPYGKEAQFQIGYKGIIQLALRTGQYAAMNEFKVNKAAFKSFNPITGELDLDMDSFDQEAGDIVGYGFYFRLSSGFEKTVYWEKEKALAHGKKYSAQFKKWGTGNWKDNFDAMAIKSVIKYALDKYGIKSVEMQNAISSDQCVVKGVGGDVSFPDNPEAPPADILDTLGAADVEEPDEIPMEEAAEKEVPAYALEAEITKLSRKHSGKFPGICATLGLNPSTWQKEKEEQKRAILDALKAL